MHVCQACYSHFVAMPSQYSNTQNTEKEAIVSLSSGRSFSKKEEREIPNFLLHFGRATAAGGGEKCQTNFPA